jgi:hypothetical protein
LPDYTAIIQFSQRQPFFSHNPVYRTLFWLLARSTVERIKFSPTTDKHFSNSRT